MSGVSAEYVQNLIIKKLAATHAEVTDASDGCGQIMEAIIVAPQFEGKTTLARNRLVNKMLKEEISQVHAWSQKCYTPAQWEKMQGATETEAKTMGH